MARKSELFAVAEEMFVAQLANVAAIADKLGVSEKTIRNWKAEGEWDRKRSELLRDGSSIVDRQRKIATRVADLIDKMLDEGEIPPRHLFAYLVSYGGGAEKARAFEEASRPVEEGAKAPPSVTEESLAAVKKRLGL